MALLKKGLFFCRQQFKKAAISFQKILRGGDSNITDALDVDDDSSDHSEDECGDSDDSGDDGEADEPSSTADDSMRPFNASNMTWIWEFPYNVSQSTFQGGNGSNACGIIALLIAQGIHLVNCDLDPSQVLPSVWVTLVCDSIKVGNAVYTSSRASLPPNNVFLLRKQQW